jgi:hypothetical protein
MCLQFEPLDRGKIVQSRLVIDAPKRITDKALIDLERYPFSVIRIL